MTGKIRPTPILLPRSVAVVGATERPGSYGETVVRNLDEAGFAGPLYPINPNRETVFDHRCLPSLADLPEPVDAVFIAVPAPAVTPAVREAIAAGCGGAVVVSAGFGESAAGRELEVELAAVAREASFPVCGPNGNGVISLHNRSPLWGDSVPAGIEPGAVAMISQSGNVAVNAIGSRRGIGFHTMVSTGNQAVLDTGDWLGEIAQLDGVRAIALFQETDGDGAKLAEALATCAEREIGVAVLKVGTSKAGQAAAAAHTGAIAGDQKVFRALVEEAGAAWATDPHELLEITRVLAEPRARPRPYVRPQLNRSEELPDGNILDILEGDTALPAPGLAILTCSGGDSGIAADQAEEISLQFAEIWAVGDRLKKLLPDAATVGNPLDYTSLLWFETERLTEIVSTVGECESVEQMIIFHDHPADLRPEHESEWSVVRRALTDGAIRSGTPAILASTLPDLVSGQARAELAEVGIPVVGGIRAAIAAASASQKLSRLDRGKVAERLKSIASAARAEPEMPSDSRSTPGSSGQAGNGGEWLSEHQVKSMLRDSGITVPDSLVATTPAACLDAAVGLEFPLALKLSASSIQHKSELGAISIGIADEAALLAAAEDLMAVAGQIHLRAAQGRPIDDQPEQTPKPPVFLVEEMAGEGIELIVSARTDAVVPSLTIGLGGIWAEYLADSVVIPLPAPPAEVLQALTRLKAYGLIAGFRNTEGADLGALASFASKVGHLLLEYRDPAGRSFDLIELNPVLAGPEGSIALDAVAHLS